MSGFDNFPMKKSLSAVVDYFSQENLVLDIALSSALVMGFALIGFLSRAMMMDIQASLFLIS